MKLFKSKKPEFIAAICPECGGKLELDDNFETAFCTECGAHCIVENVVKKSKLKKQTNLDKIIGYIERRQDLRRKDRAERVARQERQLKKTWFIYIVVLIIIFAFAYVMAALE